MNQVTPIDFVTRAVSLEEGRYNMAQAYRDRDRIVATDGHRLHCVAGLVPQPKPGFIDGRDCDFPDYEKVLPQNTSEVATFTFTKKQVAHLGKVLKLFRDRNHGAVLEFKPNEPLTITAEDEGLSDSFKLVLTFPSINVRCAHSVKLNLKYFIEGLIAGATMTFSADSKNSKSGPQVMETFSDSCHYKAIVMPLRRDC